MKAQTFVDLTKGCRHRRPNWLIGHSCFPSHAFAVVIDMMGFYSGEELIFESRWKIKRHHFRCQCDMGFNSRLWLIACECIFNRELPLSWSDYISRDIRTKLFPTVKPDWRICDIYAINATNAICGEFNWERFNIQDSMFHVSDRKKWKGSASQTKEGGMGGQWQISMRKIRVRGGMFHFELNCVWAILKEWFDTECERDTRYVKELWRGGIVAKSVFASGSLFFEAEFS